MQQEKQLTLEELDQLAFFSEVYPKVDYEHWARMPFWTLSEAVYLSVNLVPDCDYDEPPENFDKRLSPVLIEFRKLNELIDRARRSGELEKSTRPIDFLKWAQAKQIDLPKELEQRVRDIAGMKQPSNDTEKALSTKERDSLLKLVIGLAVGGYSYNPKEKRSEAVPDIVGDFERLGIALSADTVRKWLRQAAEFLPPSEK